MKVFEFCPFFNENKVAEIKIRENANWVDQLYILEANKTFTGKDKPYNFDQSLLTDKVHYEAFDVHGKFREIEENKDYYNPDTCRADQFDRWYWGLLSNNYAFFNESVQRNMCSVLKETVSDDDIIILADLDEIIDHRFVDRIVEEVKKHQVLTVKLHYTSFYLNLFLESNHGAPDCSYRLFVMTGRYFKSMPFTSDFLRKKGIAEALYDVVPCLDFFAGFHHSWVDHLNNGLPKLKAFDANVKDKTILTEEYLEKCIKDKRLHYLDANLYMDDTKKFLTSLDDVDINGLWLKEQEV